MPFIFNLFQGVVEVAPPRPIGGRGAMMQRFQQQASQQIPEHSELTSVSQTPIEIPAPVSRGRGRLIQMAME